MTFPAQNPREAYLSASVTTASPGQLLVMLYERLVLDLQRATDALRRCEPSQAHAPLLHAQDIVLELSSSLRVDVWDGATGLAALYDYLYRELVRANMHKDLAVSEFCLETALSTMNSQSQWLAGQIASLPTYSS